MQRSTTPAGVAAGPEPCTWGLRCPGFSVYSGVGPLLKGPNPEARAGAGPEEKHARRPLASIGARPNAPGPNNGGLAPKGAMEHPNTEVVVLPDAGRDEQIERWGLKADRLGDHLFTSDRRGHGPDDAVDVGESADDPDEARELEERGFILDGGWHAVEPTKGSVRGGGTRSHRGVLHPDEYVDEASLRVGVERELGFTFEQVRSVYRQGRLSATQRELRASIDARLLALSRAGGNVAALGRVLGFHVNEAGACEALNNALARARQEES